MVDVLEHLLARYPDSELAPPATARLVDSYRALGEHAKVAGFYEAMFKRNPALPDRTFVVYALDYAKALEASGNTGEARTWYGKVLEKEGNSDSLEARVAQERLTGMK